MGFFNKEVELIIPPSARQLRVAQNHKNDKSVKVKSLNGYDAIREKIDEGNTLTTKTPVEQNTKPKTKVSIGL